MTHPRRPAILIALIAACAASMVLAGAAQSRGGTGGNGGNTSPPPPPPPPDILATVSTQLFSIPPTVTDTTRLWVNRSLNATGAAGIISSLIRVEIECELETDDNLLSLRILSSSTGSVRFEQTTQCLKPLSPPRSMCIDMPVGNASLTVTDTAGTRMLALPDDARAVLRRAGDIWSPSMMALGQFETVVSATPITYQGRPCVALALGGPRLPGLQSGTVYLDAVTYLPVGQETNIVRDILISGRTTIMEWQTISGVQVPKVIQHEGTDGTSTLRFTSVTLVTSN